jgi:RNA polymerase sigma-70 factor (ECF subfamily)
MPLDALSSDGSLIAAALAGDEPAFVLLVERYRAPLSKAASSRLGRRELAEEAVQEAFLCAHRWLGTYDSRYSFRTWLWTILLNQCTRLAKREARHGSNAEPARADVGDVCRLASPLEQLLARERSEHLHELLKRLPDAQADALRLRFFGGLTFPELAAAMGCSEPGAKHRVKAALLKLSQWMQPSADEMAATKGQAGSLPHEGGDNP